MNKQIVLLLFISFAFCQAVAKKCPSHSLDRWMGYAYSESYETDRNILRHYNPGMTAQQREDSLYWFYQYGLTNSFYNSDGELVEQGIRLVEPPYCTTNIYDFAYSRGLRILGQAFRVRGEKATPMEDREITLTDISNAVNRIFWSTVSGHYTIPKIGTYYSVSGKFLCYVASVELDDSNTMIYLFSDKSTSVPTPITFICPYSEVPLETLLNESCGEFRRVDPDYLYGYLFITGEEDDPPTVVNRARRVWRRPKPVIPGFMFSVDGKTDAERERNRILWGIMLTEVPGFNIFTGEGVRAWRDGWAERNRLQAEGGHKSVFVIHRMGINER